MLQTPTQPEETKAESSETLPLQIASAPAESSSSSSSSAPKSLVAQQKDHSKRDKLISKYFSLFYDALTIFISIADITTDIIVLISYYLSNRMTFFYISLIILIISQIGYLIVFFLSFDCEDFVDLLVSKFCWCRICDKISNCIDITLNQDNKCMECACIAMLVTCMVLFGLFMFCLLLPFGHLVSFLMYFAENEDSKFSIWLSDTVGIKKRINIPLEDHLSEMAKFTISKINKHGGFMLEAFLEALPQSILQLVAMVYFKQTNYIAVGSIILSMTSIMTKSLVISQGIEWKSYFFCWICVCTDFFSIFFVVSWIFLSNEYINGDFLGHFSLIGHIWFIKISIGIIPPILFAAIGYLCVGMWFLAAEIWRENSSSTVWQRMLLVFLFLTFGNAVIITGYCVGALIACLILEIICFSIVAIFIWLLFTVDRWDYTEKKIANVIKILLDFISNGSYRNNDIIIRILCINYAYDEKSKLSQYILEKKNEETLHTVTYKNIRNNCVEPAEANIIQTGFKLYFELWKEYKTEAIDNFNANDAFEDTATALAGAGGLLLIYTSLPIYLLSRVVTILYPYFIVGYLFYYNLWFKMHIFELCMLSMYCLLQLIVFVMFYFVFKTHLWLWHIIPGCTSSYAMSWSSDLNPFLNKLYPFYDFIQWFPFVRDIVLNHFGQDIGQIIVDYLKE